MDDGEVSFADFDWQEVGQLIEAVERLNQVLRELIDVLQEGFGLWVAGGK